MSRLNSSGLETVKEEPVEVHFIKWSVFGSSTILYSLATNPAIIVLLLLSVPVAFVKDVDEELATSERVKVGGDFFGWFIMFLVVVVNYNYYDVESLGLPEMETRSKNEKKRNIHLSAG